MALAAILIAAVGLAACSQGLSEEEVETRARAMAEDMAKDMAPQGMTEADVEARAKVMAEEMAADMGGDMMVSERLATVRERDKVICASRNDVPGYGFLDDAGNNVGFDIDLCRALAAAVLGDPKQDRDPADHRRRPRADHPVGRSRYARAHGHLDHLPRRGMGQLRPDDVLRRTGASW